jgi:hypothetical protein
MKTSTTFLLGLACCCHDASGFAPSSSSLASSLKHQHLTTSVLFDYDNKNSFSMPEIDFSSITDRLSNFDADQMVANIKGDGAPLGSRGEYYVLAQGVLIVCILIGGIPYAGPAFQFM